MKIHSYIKTNGDKDFMDNQNHLINTYITNNHIKIAKRFKYQGEISQSKIENHLEQIIISLSNKDVLLVSGLEVLGDSTFNILRRISILRKNNIIVHLIKERLILSFENKELDTILLSLLDYEQNLKSKRVMIAKETRLKNGTKVGRKSGKSTKSIFDKHKVKIKELYSKGVKINRILEEIQINATAQALGKYIKKLNLEKKEKEERAKLKKQSIRKVNMEKLDKAIYRKYYEKDMKRTTSQESGSNTDQSDVDIEN